MREMTHGGLGMGIEFGFVIYQSEEMRQRSGKESGFIE